MIDIHAHTSVHDMKGLHVTRADIGDIRAVADKYGIGKICLMATYFPLKGSGLHNEELLRRTEGNSSFSCFGSLDLEGNIGRGVAELERLAAEGRLEGIKLYPGYQDIVLSDGRFSSIYEIAEKFGLPVACHMGELHHCCPRNGNSNRCGQKNCPLDKRGLLAHPEEMRKVAKDFPKVKFVASHLANPYFEELRSVMEECQNVYTDISGQFVSGSHEDTPEYRKFITRELRKFVGLEGGMERTMFATDFPIQSYSDSLDLVIALGLRTWEEKMILSENAEKILPKR